MEEAPRARAQQPSMTTAMADQNSVEMSYCRCTRSTTASCLRRVAFRVIAAQRVRSLIEGGTYGRCSRVTLRWTCATLRGGLFVGADVLVAGEKRRAEDVWCVGARLVER